MTSGAEAQDDRCRTLLETIVQRVRNALPVTDLVGPGLDPAHVTMLLAPIAAADAAIESIAGHVQRVDAVVSTGDAQWRIVFGSATAEVIDWLTIYERPNRFDGIHNGLAIVVNGPSGAGKSTLMQALQQIAAFPLVILDEPEHIGTVQAGYLIWRDQAPTLHRGYLLAIASLARAGNYVAVAAAGHQFSEFADAFADIPRVTVGLSCDVDVLVQREQRSGRWAGIAAASLGIHDGWTYDLRFDTAARPDALAIAQQVLTLADRTVNRRAP